jgi:putative N6-adenine-specific DNA methylase
MELIATCAFGLEKIVYDEIKKLGLWVIKTEDGRVTFEGDELALVKANLWLRCADRIYQSR